MRNKRIATFFMAVAIGTVALAGCKRNLPVSQGEAGTVEVTTAAEEEDTGDASLDNPRNQDEIGDRELLVVSFGTSYNENRRLSIGGIEEAMEQGFPEYSVRRGFTSQIIIDHIMQRDQVRIDNVEEALERAVRNGVKNLVIQPTHLMNGFEYQDLVKEAAPYADSFEQLAIGAPLLTSEKDFAVVRDAIVQATQQYDDGTTAICFMGHGTAADSNGVYETMQQHLKAAGKTNYYIGTVEAAPTLEDILGEIQKGNYKKVVLRPLMIVAGDHANNDMAGEEADSWKSVFEAAGYEVECILEGLGELKEIQQLLVEHARDAKDIKSLEGAVQKDALEGPLLDGSYDISVDSDSAMFKIINCVLIVENGKMKADMTLSGTGYSKLFMGTAKEAEAASEGWIEYEEDAEGKYHFTVPVEALSQEISCAAYSKKKEQWYDRTIIFGGAENSESVKEHGETLGESQNMTLEGTYTMEVALSGGSGRATIASPVEVKAQDGGYVITLVWSSSNYDYMKVNEKKYEAVSRESGSVFEIELQELKGELPVIANTVAMGNPHEIEYVLTLKEDTLKKKE